MIPHLLNDLLLPLLLKAVATVLTALAVAAANMYRKRIRDQRVAEALAFLTTLTAQAVMAAAEEVRTLKDPFKPGAWTDAEKRRIRDGVIARVRDSGGRAVATVKRELAGGNDANLFDLLRDLTESQVEELRTKGLTPAAGVAVARTTVVNVTEAPPPGDRPTSVPAPPASDRPPAMPAATPDGGSTR